MLHVAIRTYTLYDKPTVDGASAVIVYLQWNVTIV